MPNYLEKFIVISGKHTYPQQAKTVLRSLVDLQKTTSKIQTAKPTITVPERVKPQVKRISLQ